MTTICTESAEEPIFHADPHADRLRPRQRLNGYLFAVTLG